ncbi:type II toxin-antitoxin system RelE family toxin [Cylindrospermum sp. FACHB-282]|uniref:type II toxin-antitoxin system RelE family toxin n=1 Tax=Cylindrospermum sp. FACHB-282 TaxID=2692794 RepID=UPI001685C556|nr:type II toxin-antitoxin system RelE/ParE family toxin [Cylindrospermum sp. FACHB-282]MBD2384271.1 type II toxin-antitoxin system RelE/ParE family toxin [Cylindrospermum sp. FACHB-282]
MNTQYLPSFVKDLKVLKSTPSYESIKKFAFEEIRQISTFQEIANIKKLQGYDNAYRIRVGDYRIGIIFDGETVIFERVLHRKEIYRYFPK